jgi:predicted ThiF/HesA family dinucleotide-utilizing enzyme
MGIEEPDFNKTVESTEIEVVEPFLIQVDPETQKRLHQFGLTIFGDVLVCKHAHGHEWTDNFSNHANKFGTETIWVNGMIYSSETYSPVNVRQIQDAVGIQLRYHSEEDARDNVANKYQGFAYIEYRIFFKDSSRNETYHIEYDGFKHI